MKWLAAALVLATVLLQYRLWVSDEGARGLARLEADVSTQRMDNVRLADRNEQLAAEVRDLKQGMTAIEERARSELGMITANETFFQVVPAASRVPAAEPAPRTRTALR